MSSTLTEAAAGTARFPFPFAQDSYRYSTNVEPALRRVQTAAGGWGERLLEIDGGYRSELAEREAILHHDPTRLAVLDHMRPAAWDALVTVLTVLAGEYPGQMSLTRSGNTCRWTNGLLGEQTDFVIGDEASLPEGPLRFLSRQVQEDIVLLDQREDTLWLDAGVVTFAADWSMGFDVGMRFLEVHGPVPRVHEEQIITRAQQFLLRLQPDEPYRRTNWTMTVDRKLDTSTEAYPWWGPDRVSVANDPALPDRLHLRVEVQHLLRLPRSGAILFLVRTHLLPLAELATVPAWRERLGKVLADLPEDLAEYKGISRYRQAAASWLLAGRP
jgi:dimethylamine monooxygenase subunit A